MDIPRNTQAKRAGNTISIALAISALTDLTNLEILEAARDRLPVTGPGSFYPANYDDVIGAMLLFQRDGSLRGLVHTDRRTVMAAGAAERALRKLILRVVAAGRSYALKVDVARPSEAPLAARGTE